MNPRSDIAIIGLAVRCPGARNADEFWENLKNGVESVTFFSGQEVERSVFVPVDPNDPNFVGAGFILGDIDRFDAAFFDVPPAEAELLDPQHRLFLECVWEAMENAGYDLTTYDGNVAVYAGSGNNTYMLSLLTTGRSPFESYQILIGNGKDHLATRVSYKLNLSGESVNIQTACSTSLVAVHMACQSLLSGQSDIAVAGGVSIQVPERTGYLFQQDLILSPDGHCRTFDRRAQGTVFGNGLGVVILKPLGDALRDNDHIYAVIKGSAINNDGKTKVGYTAPSVDAQAAVITTALEFAGISADTVSYVEAHGTATTLGDPIEMAALTQAFREHTQRRGFCAVGSVKTNVGHLNTASGVVGLIKTVLALYHEMIPPSLNFVEPNPKIDFQNSPFFVVTNLTAWKRTGTPRRAGVSSFGIGGTNAHVILEEAPRRDRLPDGDKRSTHVLTLSARTESGLNSLAEQYYRYLLRNPGLQLPDCCFTTNTGRVHFEHRLAVLGQQTNEVCDKLCAFSNGDKTVNELWTGQTNLRKKPELAFLFTGQGSQYTEMGKYLYKTQSIYRWHLDKCQDILSAYLGESLIDHLYPRADERSRLDETWLTQPALFAFEYALAELWLSWGVQPDLVMGHSIGEYVAACLAGAFTLEDGLRLVARRASLMNSLPLNGMVVAVFADEERVSTILQPFSDRIAIACLNGPANTVVSGEGAAVESVLSQLNAQGIAFRPLSVSHAFHSPLLDPILDRFERIAESVEFRPLQIPLVSNLSGEIVPPGTVLGASYWRQHARYTVRFADGVRSLVAAGYNIFLEVGPNPTLSHMGPELETGKDAVWLPSLQRGHDEWHSLLETLSSLYTHGVAISWKAIEQGYGRHRLPLPTYPFEDKGYWINPNSQAIFSREVNISASTAKESEPGPQLSESIPTASSVHQGTLRLEEQIARIWTHVLGGNKAEQEDDFFRAGGDSLSAIQLLAQCNQTFQVKVAIGDFFNAPTLSKLTDRIRDLLTEGQKSEDYEISLAARGETPLLSYAQQRFWFLYQFESNPSFYHVPLVVRLKGNLNISALEESLGEIQERHDTLRAHFPTTSDGAPMLAFSSAHAFVLPTINLQHLPAYERMAEAENVAMEAVTRPFDLEQGPVWRSCLINLGEGDHILVAVMHHMVSDIWSVRVFVHELTTLYKAHSAGLDTQLSKLPIQYADFAYWQRQYLQGEVLERLVSFWSKQLDGVPATLTIPTDYPRGEVRTFRGMTIPVSLPEELVDRIKAKCQDRNVSLFMFLLAAFKTLLHQYTGREDIVVGTETANRMRAETESLIGAFVNQLVLRTDLSGNPTFDEVLTRVRKVTLDAYEHQDMPFDKLVDALKAKRSANTTPFFQLKFLFDNIPVDSVELTELILERIEVPVNTSPFDVTIRMSDSSRGVRGSLTYNIDLFNQSTMTQLLQNYETLLRRVVAETDVNLNQLHVLSEQDLRLGVGKHARTEDQRRNALRNFKRRPAKHHAEA